jgi:hypothetical protein
MKVGDLVTIADWGEAGQVGERPVGLVTCFDPEEIGDPEEVEVWWTTQWTDRSNHSSWYLEVVSEQD